MSCFFLQRLKGTPSEKQHCVVLCSWVSWDQYRRMVGFWSIMLCISLYVRWPDPPTQTVSNKVNQLPRNSNLSKKNTKQMKHIDVDQQFRDQKTTFEPSTKGSNHFIFLRCWSWKAVGGRWWWHIQLKKTQKPSIQCLCTNCLQLCPLPERLMQLHLESNNRVLPKFSHLCANQLQQ